MNNKDKKSKGELRALQKIGPISSYLGI